MKPRIVSSASIGIELPSACVEREPLLSLSPAGNTPLGERADSESIGLSICCAAPCKHVLSTDAPVQKSLETSFSPAVQCDPVVIVRSDHAPQCSTPIAGWKATSRSQSLTLPRSKKSFVSTPWMNENIPLVRHAPVLSKLGQIQALRELAAALSRPVDELRWIGVFALVPIACVRRIEVDEKRGELRIFVKATKCARAGSTRTTASLAMARSTTDGRIVQRVIANPTQA
jgi:hypothetical protein